MIVTIADGLLPRGEKCPDEQRWQGHVVLADFGSCLKLNSDGKVQSSVAVGTPDYISPEILRAMEDSQGKYGRGCDWWSLGVCLYEMLYGETPFYAESLVETYGKIMNHEEDGGVVVSDDAKDLMLKLITTPDRRLGLEGISDFKAHPFFAGIDWDNIRNSKAPFIPEVNSPTDTSNFDVDDADFRSNETVPPTSNSAFTGRHLPFVGFTFTSNSRLSDLGSLILSDHDVTDIMPKSSSTSTLTHSSSKKVKVNGTTAGKNDHELHIERLEKEKNELLKQLREADPLFGGHHHLPHHHHQPNSPSQGIPDSSHVMMEDERRPYYTLDRSFNKGRLERESLSKEHDELREKNRQLVAEIKELKVKMQADSLDLNEKLSDSKVVRQKLTRQLKEREEELRETTTKLDRAKDDLKKYLTANKEVELVCLCTLQDSLTEATLELDKQRMLLENANSACQEFEEELKSLKQDKKSGDQKDESLMEINKLRSELEKCRLRHEEEYTRLQLRCNNELQKLKDQLSESDSHRVQLQSDMDTLKHSFESVKRDLTERQELYEEERVKMEREKDIMLADISKIMDELESLQTSYDTLESEKSSIETELQELKDKKMTPQQIDQQINDIISWVNDEKEARTYLEGLANRLNAELEDIKQSGVQTVDKMWKNRRSQKLDKKTILDLQSSLNSEIQAKENIGKELSLAKSKQLEAESKCKDLEKQLEEHKKEINKIQVELNYEKAKGIERALNWSQLIYSSSSNTNGPMKSFIHDSRSNSDVSGDRISMDRPGSGNNLNKRDSHQSPSSSIIQQQQQQTPSPQQQPQQQPQQPQSTITAKSLNRNSQQLSPTTSTTAFTTSTPLLQVLKKQQQQQHKFSTISFNEFHKCQYCTSLLFGLERQGMVCENCSYSCHIHCARKVPPICPIPADLLDRPIGIDPNKGIGTAYEGYAKIPKPGGIRKGWMKQFVVVCDFKIFLYDTTSEKSIASQQQQQHVTNVISQVIDMRDEDFSVSSVSESEVIHADKKDIPFIFKIRTSMLSPPGLKFHLLMLADNEQDRMRWVCALSELHKVLIRNKIPNKAVYTARQIYDEQFPSLFKLNSVAIADKDRLLFGTEEGMYLIELSKDVIIKVGERNKCFQLDVISEEQVIIAIIGKQRTLHLLPTSILESDRGLESAVKLDEYRSVSLFVTCSPSSRHHPSSVQQQQNQQKLQQQSSSFSSAPPPPSSSSSTFLSSPASTTGAVGNPGVLLCIACKRVISVCEIGKVAGRKRCRKIKDIQCKNEVHCMDVKYGRLFVGCTSSFYIYTLINDGSSLSISLLNADDPSLNYISQTPVTAYAVMETQQNDYLLVFSTYKGSHLVVHTENNSFVYDIDSAEWIQTIPLKKTKTLNQDGSIVLSSCSDLYSLIYLRNFKDDIDDAIYLPDLYIPKQQQPQQPQQLSSAMGNRFKRKFSFKTLQEVQAAKVAQLRKSKVISAPQNFSHVVHLGSDAVSGLSQESSSSGSGRSYERKSRIISNPTNFSHVAHIGQSQALPTLIDLPAKTNAVTDEEKMEQIRSLLQQNLQYPSPVQQLNINNYTRSPPNSNSTRSRSPPNNSSLIGAGSTAPFDAAATAAATQPPQQQQQQQQQQQGYSVKLRGRSKNLSEVTKKIENGEQKVT
ncbi:hypothetical protein HELRODRAFT_191553 [Helobdella robusta]|uniref:non-specific serine/threonine protein kinase n=1 Tax=Helobdella robusta TaxID=6412 RepID=T1FT27_HELRO|nr:hypothetical protein HELRODRAFT_191553 [Helobdella robusta]ESO05018.1 hypothetical protein HELRODRAFT_191553 [Helobdella robusta]